MNIYIYIKDDIEILVSLKAMGYILIHKTLENARVERDCRM